MPTWFSSFFKKSIKISEMEKFEYLTQHLHQKLTNSNVDLLEGIFRKSGNQKNIRTHFKKIQNKKAPPSLEKYSLSIHDIVGIIKKMIEHLSNQQSLKKIYPIETDAINKALIGLFTIQSTQDKAGDSIKAAKNFHKKIFMTHFHNIIEKTPALKNLFLSLMLIIKHHEKTKMSEENIAIVLAGTLQFLISGTKPEAIKKKTRSDGSIAQLMVPETILQSLFKEYLIKLTTKAHAPLHFSQRILPPLPREASAPLLFATPASSSTSTPSTTEYSIPKKKPKSILKTPSKKLLMKRKSLMIHFKRMHSSSADPTYDRPQETDEKTYDTYKKCIIDVHKIYQGLGTNVNENIQKLNRLIINQIELAQIKKESIVIILNKYEGHVMPIFQALQRAVQDTNKSDITNHLNMEIIATDERYQDDKYNGLFYFLTNANNDMQKLTITSSNEYLDRQFFQGKITIQRNVPHTAEKARRHVNKLL